MFKTFKIELKKLKHSNILPIIFLIPMVCLVLGISMVKVSADNMKDMDPWFRMYFGSMIYYSSLFLPCVISFVMAMVARVEHKDNGWKQLLALPVKRGYVYFSKFLIGILIVLSNVLVLIAGMLICGKILGINTPVPYDMIVVRPLLVLASTAPIIALLYYLSIRFSHIGVPAGGGIALAFPAIIISNSTRYWIYYPWTYPIFTAMSSSGMGFNAGDKITAMWIVCIAGFVVISLAGLIRFRKYDVI
jgi:Uncharacterized protein conserved in bacteria